MMLLDEHQRRCRCGSTSLAMLPPHIQFNMESPMESPTFSFRVTPKQIELDRLQQDLLRVSESELNWIAEGSIQIKCQSTQQVLATINDSVIYYLEQLACVLFTLECGHDKTFSVSGDYFNNSFQYTMNHDRTQVTMYDVIEKRIVFTAAYDDFRNSLLMFFRSALRKIKEIYPELRRNIAFQKYEKIFDSKNWNYR
ncbi:MAG: hypothetical protein R3C01_08530 [Planctomycetaceae bacterium]